MRYELMLTSTERLDPEPDPTTTQSWSSRLDWVFVSVSVVVDMTSSCVVISFLMAHPCGVALIGAFLMFDRTISLRRVSAALSNPLL